MEIAEEIYEAHKNLSPCSAKFLDFVKNNPESLKRSNYSDLIPGFDSIKLQPWPTFIDQKTKQQLREAGVKVFDLITSVPHRFFANDPAAISRYYEMPLRMVSTLLDGMPKNHMNNLLARGDFILSPSGLKCLEYNFTANLGGWQVDMWEQELYLKNAVISRFLGQYAGKRKKNIERVLPVLFNHLVSTALDKFPGIGKVLNIILVSPNVNGEDSRSNIQPPRLNTFPQLDIRIRACPYQDLKIVNNKVYYREEQVHVLLEQYGGIVPPGFIDAFREGNVLVYNGRIVMLMSNKMNLAVLSENHDSDIFSAGEREAIDTYIPWTRKITPGQTTYAGKAIDLGPFVSSHRDQLIIKPTIGYGGQAVYLGKYMTEARWQEVVNTALKSRRWVVQEYVESFSYLYQAGETGCVPHSLVWGVFIFGSHYGGGWVRVLPKEGSAGVVNRHQGAEEGIIVEMDE